MASSQLHCLCAGLCPSRRLSPAAACEAAHKQVIRLDPEQSTAHAPSCGVFSPLFLKSDWLPWRAAVRCASAVIAPCMCAAPACMTLHLWQQMNPYISRLGNSACACAAECLACQSRPRSSSGQTCLFSLSQVCSCRLCAFACRTCCRLEPAARYPACQTPQRQKLHLQYMSSYRNASGCSRYSAAATPLSNYGLPEQQGLSNASAFQRI